MKVLSVLQAQSLRAMRITAGTTGYLPDAVRRIADRYHFVAVPTQREELLPDDANNGITFRLGKYEHNGRAIVIDFLQIFPAGIGITTRTNTSDSDLVLGDLLDWSKEITNVQYEFARPGTLHNSQLEIRLERPLAELLPSVRETAASISPELDEFWETRPQYELAGVTLSFDRTKFPAIAPPIFRLDRREGVPFEQNLYYSEAPLSTDKHIAVLEQLERTCLSFASPN